MDLGLYFRQPVTVRGCGWSEAATKADLSLFLVRLQGGPLLTLRVNGGVYTQGRLGPTQVISTLELEKKVHTKVCNHTRSRPFSWLKDICIHVYCGLTSV